MLHAGKVMRSRREIRGFPAEIAACVFTISREIKRSCMHAFFAMGVPTTDDSSGYFRLLPHMWPVFVVPVVCLYVVLAAWVTRKLRGGDSKRTEGTSQANSGGLGGP